jgi:DNA-binding CsgD family transcriptional regulator
VVVDDEDAATERGDGSIGTDVDVGVVAEVGDREGVQTALVDPHVPVVGGDHIDIDRAANDPNGLPLTDRELEVSRLIASGRSTRQTAAELFISPETVEFHLGRAYRKLGVTNRAQLTRAIIAAVSQP